MSRLLYLACGLLSMLRLFVFLIKLNYTHTPIPLFLFISCKKNQLKTNVKRNNEDRKGKMINEKLWGE
jgi:hypothetical protein